LQVASGQGAKSRTKETVFDAGKILGVAKLALTRGRSAEYSAGVVGARALLVLERTGEKGSVVTAPLEKRGQKSTADAPP
jgi:hypothetical protein